MSKKRKLDACATAAPASKKAAKIKYNYQDLAEGSIRLLELLPGRKKDSLECSLLTVQLKDCPNYEAISYVWGDPNPPVYLSCGERCVTITTNLASGMRQIRLKDKSRFLWADQVCINQADISERSAQVRIMGEIFKKAECVIAWLGPDDSFEAKAPLAVRMIERLAKVSDQQLFQFEKPTNEALVEHDLPPLSSPEWTGLAAFLSLPYFSRVWILQEIRLAASHHLLWGTTDLHFAKVRQATRFLRQNPALRCEGPLENIASRTLSNIRDIWRRSETFVDFVHMMYERHSTDQRDKVYGVLGMIQGVSEQLQPDYSKSTLEVFISAVQFSMEHAERDLSLLYFAGTVNHLQDPKHNFDGWPSWVPPWHAGRIIKIPHDVLAFRADSGEGLSVQQPLSIEHKVLSVTGLIVDVAGHVFHFKEHPLPSYRTVLRSSRAKEMLGDVVVKPILKAWKFCMAHSRPSDVNGVARITSFINALVRGWERYDSLSPVNIGLDDMCCDFANFWGKQVILKLKRGSIRNIHDLRAHLQLAEAAMILTRSPDRSIPAVGTDAFELAIDSVHTAFWNTVGPSLDADDVAGTMATMREILCKVSGSPEEIEAVVIRLTFYCYSRGNSTRFLAAFLEAGFQSVLFVMDDGKVGWAPMNTQPNDVVAILFGAKVPLILRSAAADSYYTLLGECYLEGVMQGEYVEELRERGELEEAKTIFHII